MQNRKIIEVGLEDIMGKYVLNLSDIFEAEPMTYGEFAKRFDIHREGHERIETMDGYGYQSPSGRADWDDAHTFNSIYASCDRLPFSRALDLVKKGCRITRQKWNSREMVVVYHRGCTERIPCNGQTADACGLQKSDLCTCNPYLQIRQPDGSRYMWIPSMDDILADDWMLIEEA